MRENFDAKFENFKYMTKNSFENIEVYNFNKTFYYCTFAKI